MAWQVPAAVAAVQRCWAPCSAAQPNICSSMSPASPLPRPLPPGAGEMLVGPIRALFADEISTGLDSNTTYQVGTRGQAGAGPHMRMRTSIGGIANGTFVASLLFQNPSRRPSSLSPARLTGRQIMRAMRNFAHTLSATCVVGLLQPQPEAFELFDAVILLSSGKVGCGGGPALSCACRVCQGGCLGRVSGGPGKRGSAQLCAVLPASPPPPPPPPAPHTCAGVLPRPGGRRASLLPRPGLLLPAPPRRSRLPAGSHHAFRPAQVGTGAWAGAGSTRVGMRPGGWGGRVVCSK